MNRYAYEYLKLPINTSPDELDAAINEVAQRGMKLVQVIPNYTYFTRIELQDEHGCSCKFNKAEEMVVIFEKVME